MSISTKDLIALFHQALDEQWGYIYGASGQIWTQAKQNKATRTQTKKYGQQWVGRRVSDCSGLFYWAFKELEGSCYHGSNTIFKKYTSVNGTLIHGVPSDGSALKPGTAVFKYNTSEGYHHIGLYIGSNTVIEAKGTRYGVVASTPASGWTHWGELKGVDYSQAEQDTEVTVLYEAKVVTAQGSLNVRCAPGTSAAIITRLPQNTVVSVTDSTDGWLKIRTEDAIGWVSAQFLARISDGNDASVKAVIEIVDSEGNTFRPAGDYTVKVVNE